MILDRVAWASGGARQSGRIVTRTWSLSTALPTTCPIMPPAAITGKIARAPAKPAPASGFAASRPARIPTVVPIRRPAFLWRISAIDETDARSKVPRPLGCSLLLGVLSTSMVKDRGDTSIHCPRNLAPSANSTTTVLPANAIGVWFHLTASVPAHAAGTIAKSISSEVFHMAQAMPLSKRASVRV